MKSNQRDKKQNSIFDWGVLGQAPANNACSNRKLLAHIQRREQIVSTQHDIYKVVCDANFLWNVIAFYLRKSEGEEYLIELSLAGFCELHAPTWLLEEMASSVFKPMARQHRVSTFILKAIFEEFIADHIIFHEGYEPLKTLAYPENIDPKDVPYTELARDIDALGVVSHDKDIEALLSRRLDTNFIEVAIRITRLENGVVQAKLAALIGVSIVGHLAEDSTKAITNAVKKLPPFALYGTGAAVLLGSYLYLRDEQRRRKANVALKKAKPALKTVGKVIWDGIDWAHRSKRDVKNLRQSLELD